MQRDNPGSRERVIYAGNHTVTPTDVRKGHLVINTALSGAVLTMFSPTRAYRDWEFLVTNDGNSGNNVTMSGSAMFAKGTGTVAIDSLATVGFMCKQDYSGTWRWFTFGNSQDVDLTSVSGLAVSGFNMGSGGSGVALGISGIAQSGFDMGSGGSGVALGISGIAQSGFSMGSGASGLVAAVATLSSGASGIAAGGSGIAAGGSGIAAGGSGIAAGGSGIAAGAGTVASGASGIAAGGSGIAAGGSGIAAGGSGIAAGASGMAVTASGSIYKGWAAWTNPITWSGGLAPDGVVWVGRTRSGSGGVEAVGYLTFTDGSGAILESIAPPLAWADIDCYVPFIVHQSLISGVTTNYTSGAYLLANEANAAGVLTPIHVAALTSQWSGTIGFRIAYEV